MRTIFLHVGIDLNLILKKNEENPGKTMAEGGTYRVTFSEKRQDASIAMPTPGGQETNTMRKHKRLAAFQTISTYASRSSCWENGGSGNSGYSGW